MDKNGEFKENLLIKVNKIAKEQGYYNYVISTSNISTHGGNALSLLHEVNIREHSEENIDKILHIFVKQFKYDSNMSLISMSGIFTQELFVYKELFTIYNTMQIDANIPLVERFKWIKCYDDSDSDMILFENVSKLGFKTLNRKDVIPLEFAELCIKELAKFHALSFALEKLNPEFFKQKISIIKHPYKLVEKFDDYKDLYKGIGGLTLNYLKVDLKLKAEKFFLSSVEKIAEFQNIENAKARCFCHGDFMANNILQKQMDGKVTNILPIDYQLSHYGCPVLDFHYFLFAVTDQEFRRRHLNNLKDLYYTTLANYLQHFNIDIKHVYNREKFEQDFKDKLLYGLLMAMLQLPFIMTPESVADELSQSENLPKFGAKPDDRFGVRVQGLFSDFDEWGYL